MELDPQEAFAHFSSKVVEALSQQFPIKSKQRTMRLDGIEVTDKYHPDDIKSQYRARMDGGTWGESVMGQVSLIDNATGKVIDKKKVRLAEVPRMTKRYSYIVGGQEYQVDNQWQLKPGAYGRRTQKGEVEVQFNGQGPGSKTFHLKFHPEKKQFIIEWNKANIPLYPVLQTLGVQDHQLEKIWGKDILTANKTARGASGAIQKLYKSDKGVNGTDEEVRGHLLKVLEASKMDPQVVKATLGVEHGHVTPETLQAATKKMMDIHNGAPEDDRDSLNFKRLRSVGDFAYDKIRSMGYLSKQKILRKMDNATSVRDAIKLDTFNDAIHKTYKKNQAARIATQINPLEMVAAVHQTTVMGTGGIQSEHGIVDETKYINPSHFGFLDPISTPEGGKSGVTLRLPMGVKRKGDDPVIPLYNTKTGKIEEVTPLQVLNSHVALPDQYTWKDNKPVQAYGDVKYFGHGNELKVGTHKDVEYIMRYPGQAFNISSNLIPFLHSTQGNRAGMATRHMEQAISLVHREAPLVQSGTGFNNPKIHTFEQIVGKQITHQSPVDGTVTAIGKDSIKVKDASGTEHEVQLYNHYPLNDAKSTMHSTPVPGLAVGSKVQKDQLLADTNYSKDGRLALGTNLHVAFMPYHGINYEDGIVISESAAKKLSSQHLTKHKMEITEGLVTDPRKFHVRHPLAYKVAQLQKLGDNGVVRVGQKLNPGDPIMVATQPYQLKDRIGLTATRKHLAGAHVDKSVKWDSEHAGEVVAVHHVGDKVEVHVKTVEPMQVGDKISGRSGNKGIAVEVVEDHLMPRDKNGKHMEVLLNPLTVPSRINPSQVFETVAGKIAQKTGKPFIVNSFKPHVDQVEELKSLAKQHGVSATDELFDPVTGKSFGQVQTGPMHMIKLVHQIEKKSSVRSGMSLPGHNPEKYDLNLQPRGGSHTGGQSIGALGMYALLAHGAKATIRESQTYRSEGPDPQTNETKKWKSQHNDVWNAIQRGTPIPPPATTFAFQKFTDMLRAAAINVEKKGHEFVLTPMTDKQILSMSAGALPDASHRVTYKTDAKGEFVPKKGGLFDEHLTGGNGGRKWTHIKLSEPVPNPIFEEAICAITNLKGKEFNAVVSGEASVTPTGQFVDNPHGGLTGGAAIAHMLKGIDVDKELVSAKDALNKAHASKVDPHLKKVKYLETLKRLNLKPQDAYVLHNLPVIPPVMRPISALPDGGVAIADLNDLYAKFAMTNMQLGREVVQKSIPLQELQNHRKNYYDGVKALMGVGIPYGEVKHKGLLHQIAGSSPKEGFFQNVLGNKRQDLSMRSTVVPEPALGLDQVGIPKQYALDLFRPFVVRQLTLMGAAPHALAAQEMMAKKDPIAIRALEKVMEERPVLIKRDPVLHKYGIQGFKPVLVEGSAIKTHPMVCEGFNLDHDGDTMSVFVPISKEAVAEAHKMMPSNNLFAESSGKVMYTPKKEGGFGLYRLSLVNEDSKQVFKHPGDAVSAVMQRKLGINDLAHIDGKHTTVGRVLMAAALPEHMQHKMLTDHAPLNSKNIENLFTDIAKHSESSNDRKSFGRISNRLKDLGNGASTGLVPVLHLEGKDNLDPAKQKFLPIGALTLSLKDFTPDRANRDPVIAEAHKRVKAIMDNPAYSAGEKERRVVLEWSKAEEQFQKAHVAEAKKDPTNLFHMHMSGQKPGMDQYKQLALAPMLVKDTSGRTVPIPLTKTFSEGLDMAGYWVGMYGARRGVVRKVQEVQEPGVITKMMQNTTMDTLVTADDCGTKKGVSMPVTSADIHDRHLAQDLTIGNTHYAAGTVLTPKVVGAIRAVKPDLHLQVRSPLKCEHDKGVCQKCYGTWHNGRAPEYGTNVGVIAAHALGERVTQLMLRSFHSGGVAGKANAADDFDVFKNLVTLPDKLENQATIAMKSGTVKKIEHDKLGTTIWVDDKPHFVGKDQLGNPLHEILPHQRSESGWKPWEPAHVGMTVKAGQHLSDPNRTIINPKHLYQATKSIEAVQNHLSTALHNIFGPEGVDRRHAETLVKAMTSATKIDNPGAHPELLRGEVHNTQWIRTQNQELNKQGKPLIRHTPILRGINTLPLYMREDWMAKLQHQHLRDTIMDAASRGLASDIHGVHPVPGITYGAEFGLNKAHSNIPGYEKLKDVPITNY